MSSGCGDVLSLEDLRIAKLHQTFEAEVITGKAGGIAGGADIDYATNPATGQVQKTLPAVLRDAGFFPASFDFTTGGTLGVNDRNKVVYDPVSMAWYSWAGSLPKVVPAGTNPLLDANWKPQTDPKLRDELAADDGFKLIGQCDSMAELRALVPTANGQSALLRSYYAGMPGLSGLIYDWNATSTETDDGGLTIKVNSLTTGRFKLRQKGSVYDVRIWGMLPEKVYSPSQQNIKTMLDKAIAAVGPQGVLHFALPDGWSEAHYLNDFMGQNFSGCYISSDYPAVILHSPLTSDNEGQKPRLAGPVFFSNEAPSNTGTNTARDQRDINKYPILASMSSAMAAVVPQFTDRFERLQFLSGARAIRIANLAAAQTITNDATGMTISNEAVQWSNAASAGTDWQGVELAAAAGSEIDVQLRNLSAAGSGTVLIGARMLNNYGTSGSVFNYRFVIGTDGFKFYNGATEVPSGGATTWHPEDQIQTVNGSVRAGIRIGPDSMSLQLVLNGRAYPLISGTNKVRSIVIMADQTARANVRFQYAHHRMRTINTYARGLKICTLGDSISRGARSSNEWPSLVANYGEHFPGVGKVSVDNSMSVVGLRMNTVALNIATYSFVGFDYVMVALGINDCQATGDSGIGVYSAAIDTVANKIKADGAIPIFGTPYRYLTASQTGNGNDTTFQQDLPFFQHTLRERCAANGYLLAEMGDAMGDSAGSLGGFSASGFMNAWTHDNIHANSRGQQGIAATFLAALSRAQGSGATPSMAQLLPLAGTFTSGNETVTGFLRCSRVDNTVHVSGSIAGGTASTGAVFATLPSWARPSQSVFTVAYSAAAAAGFVHIEVRQSGDLVTSSNYAVGRTDINISFNV
ncbi:MAG: hypothetical protein [Caudoviricetes sp.]|nr:MAG: hypothetical protein [Caudoviricetes sp.]